MNLQRSTRAAVSVMPVSAQVAAVCYRQGRAGVEFLLVRTSSGRWIFPKGHMEESLSGCEAALREASEEAGAIGRIEPRRFHVFRYWKSNTDELFFVEAYLLEVLRTATPEEEHREPTWFESEAARRAIAEGRDEQAAAELRSVIDHAVTKVRAGSGARSSRRRSLPHS